MRRWFGDSEGTSVGQILDSLLTMRQQGISWTDVANAIAADRNFSFSQPSEEKMFRNPIFAFGPYEGRTVMDVIVDDPDYIRAIVDGTSEAKVADFWVEQCRLAADMVSASGEGA